MNVTMRIVAVCALLGFLAGCAELGIPAPSGGITTPDTEIYELTPSD